ncbi:MAG: hypothetical protein GC204_14755 [Chloroflexi bacterium]|nr:hypothetical protein [Chloroflexota bacterium]
MTSRRFWGFVLVGLFFIMFSLSMRTTPVEAENLLQNVPRLDGMNIYFTESSGEASRFDRTDPGLSRYAGLLSQLGANLFTLEWRTGFPTDADLIVIAGPTSDLAPDQIARLWSYVNNKGHLLLLTNPINENRTRALSTRSGLFSLMWADMGLHALDDVVSIEGTTPIYATPTPEPTDEISATEAAAATAEVALTATEPAIIGERPILITDFSTDQFDKSSPITQDLDGPLAFFTARSLEVDASIQSFVVTPLVFSPSTFYGESDYGHYLSDGTFNFNIGSDTTRGPLPLAAAFSNDHTASRIVVIGDREFATNGYGLRTSPPNSAAFVYPNNARFLLNATTWLLDKESVAVEFPTAAPTATVTITPSPTPTNTPTPTPTPTPPFDALTAEATVAP